MLTSIIQTLLTLLNRNLSVKMHKLYLQTAVLDTLEDHCLQRSHMNVTTHNSKQCMDMTIVLQLITSS